MEFLVVPRHLLEPGLFAEVLHMGVAPRKGVLPRGHLDVLHEAFVLLPVRLAVRLHHGGAFLFETHALDRLLYRLYVFAFEDDPDEATARGQLDTGKGDPFLARLVLLKALLPGLGLGLGLLRLGLRLG